MSSNQENNMAIDQPPPKETATNKEEKEDRKEGANVDMDTTKDTNTSEAVSPIKEVLEANNADTEISVTEINNSDDLLADVNEPYTTAPFTEEPRQEKLTKFPMGRVKHIMKMDPDVRVVTPEATFLISKSLELFVESLAWEAHRYTEQARKKTMAKTDVDRAIDGIDALVFLEGALDD